MERDKVARVEQEREQDKDGGRAIMQLVLVEGEGEGEVLVMVRAMARVAVHFLVPLGRSMATPAQSWIGSRTVIPSR